MKSMVGSNEKVFNMGTFSHLLQVDMRQGVWCCRAQGFGRRSVPTTVSGN